MQSIAHGQVMRRRVTLRTTLYALIAAPSLLMALAAHAEEVPFISIVTGLAPDDLLNVRAKPSPIGATEARLAAGASVRNLGCNDIDGHQWCKIESDNPKTSGWTPARYLVPVNPATAAYPDVPSAAPEPDQPADAASAAAQPPAMPPDLTARMGDATDPAGPETPMQAAAVTAMRDAYGLALAANGGPSSENPAVDIAELPPQPGAFAPGGAVEIPCARYVGQPMTHCAANVVRDGADKADVTVTWPDGGTRVISFQAGQPSGSDAPDELRFTREGGLSMIRVGVSERFEITDAILSGIGQALGIRQ